MGFSGSMSSPPPSIFVRGPEKVRYFEIHQYHGTSVSVTESWNFGFTTETSSSPPRDQKGRASVSETRSVGRGYFTFIMIRSTDEQSEGSTVHEIDVMYPSEVLLRYSSKGSDECKCPSFSSRTPPVLTGCHLYFPTSTTLCVISPKSFLICILMVCYVVRVKTYIFFNFRP